MFVAADGADIKEDMAGLLCLYRLLEAPLPAPENAPEARARLLVPGLADCGCGLDSRALAKQGEDTLRSAHFGVDLLLQGPQARLQVNTSSLNMNFRMKAF